MDGFGLGSSAQHLRSLQLCCVDALCCLAIRVWVPIISRDVRSGTGATEDYHSRSCGCDRGWHAFPKSRLAEFQRLYGLFGSVLSVQCHPESARAQEHPKR
jgi:hypothetical protein